MWSFRRERGEKKEKLVKSFPLGCFPNKLERGRGLEHEPMPVEERKKQIYVFPAMYQAPVWCMFNSGQVLCILSYLSLPTIL